MEFLKSLSAEQWSALSAVAGVLLAITFQIIEWRRQRYSKGIDTIAQMDSRWDSAEFREIRRQASRFLVNPDSITKSSGEEAVRTVLNFFETLGFLERKTVVDAEAVWHFFGSWIFPYFHGSKPVMDRSRELDPNCYTELENLFKKIQKIERTAHPSKNSLHVEVDRYIKDFLRREASLELDTIPSTAPA